jgi:hypothetical protein
LSKKSQTFSSDAGIVLPPRLGFWILGADWLDFPGGFDAVGVCVELEAQAIACEDLDDGGALTGECAGEDGDDVA